MFNHAFQQKIEGILSAVSGAETVSTTALGRCLSALERCLVTAEVNPGCIRHITDTTMDRLASEPALSGARVAGQLRSLLSETPGLGGALTAWQDVSPGLTEPCSRRWDMKELENRTAGFNLASLARLRRTLGLSSELPFLSNVDFSALSVFTACHSMRLADGYDARIDGEQINRLIRYLGWGGPGADPHGGRPAVLG